MVCRSIFTPAANAPTPVPGLDELYSRYYEHAAFSVAPAARAALRRLAESFAPFRQSGRWLDIGFGEGTMLQAAREQGWHCHGTELSPQALEFGRKQGWIVSSHPENDSRFAAGSFDVVTLIEVIEHVPAPRAFLEEAGRWLRPGGLLYLTTPNALSLNCRLLGLRWSIFAPPEHLTIWSPHGLRRALAQMGWAVQELRTEGLNPTEILARLRRQSAEKAGGRRNEVAGQLNEAFSRSPWRQSTKAGINRLLSAARLGDTIKVRGVKNTCT